jgi:hypothetical protein
LVLGGSGGLKIISGVSQVWTNNSSMIF